MNPMRGIVLASLATAACQSTPADEPPADVPALATQSTPASVAELRDALGAALPGRQILLADNPFEESSLLVVERRRPQRLEGSLATGIPDEEPQRFRLRLGNDACKLIHLNTGKRYPLPKRVAARSPRQSTSVLDERPSAHCTLEPSFRARALRIALGRLPYSGDALAFWSTSRS